MKTTKNTSVKTYILLFVLAAFTFSCEEDFLDTKVDTSLTLENLKTNYAVIFEFANAPYTYLNNVSDGFSVLDNNLFAVPSDEAVQTSTGYRESNVFTQGIMNSYNNPDDIFGVCYEGIRAANYFLENYQDYKVQLAFRRDTLSDNAIQYHKDVVDIAFYMAEVRVLRAYYYYELLKRYGGVPLVTKTLEKEDVASIPRSDVAAIVNFIVSEIDQELDNLQPNWKTFDNGKTGRINKAAALAIKQRVLMLYASPLHNPGNDLTRWQNAASAGNEIISLGQFSLDANYRNYFTSDFTVKSAETIWAIRLGTSNTLEISNYPLATPGGNNEITPSHNLVSAYEYKGSPDPNNPFANRDPRLEASVVVNNSNWTNRTIETWAGGTDDYTLPNTSKTGYYLKKFLTDKLNLVQGQTKQRAWIIFRYGEILLNYAEAMNEAYGPDNDNGYGLTARQAVNMIRSRAGVLMPAVVATNQSEMRDKIKHERRIELAFEGHRYWDLIRWKDAENVLNGKVTGVVATEGPNSTFIYTTRDVENRVFDASKMYLYPIPQYEIIRTNGVISQNPGW